MNRPAVECNRLRSALPDPAGQPISTSVPPPRPLRMVNIGCGDCVHPDWINLDLVPRAAGVRPWDVVAGLPFDDRSCDAVYHSHLLEHLDEEDGRRLVGECFRVLRPGGVLRIVVPDLEQIARIYIELLEQAWRGEETAGYHYEWIKLELLDQLVRSRSGGRMGPFMASLDEARSGFVRSRIGVEFAKCRQVSGQPDSASTNGGLAGPDAGTPRSRSRNSPSAAGRRRRSVTAQGGWRWRFARWVVRVLQGDRVVKNLEEARFRADGEIHRWMYDRLSLRLVCQASGFVDFRVCGATESRIPGFGNYGLDVEQGAVRKPDSLFVECVRPLGPDHAS